MQILNLEKFKNKKKLKKSQLLLVGSLLVFFGIILISWNSIISLREEVYSDLKVEIVLGDEEQQTITTVPVAKNIEDNSNTNNSTEEQVEEVIDYSKYLGVLEIPRIGLKRGFYGLDNRYNNISYNVALVKGSTMPDVERGNLILMAHSGNAYISFFRYLFLLKVGDMAYVNYKGVKYAYQIVNIYNVPKVGQVTINRNYDKTTMTFITCTHMDDYSQTIYILEQV